MKWEYSYLVRIVRDRKNVISISETDKGQKMAAKRRENGPKRLAGNNEAQNIKRKNASGIAKGPLLAHLINTFIASVTLVHRLSGSSDVTGAPLTSCHDKTKRPQNRSEDIDQCPRAVAARSSVLRSDNVFPGATCASAPLASLPLKQKFSTTKCAAARLRSVQQYVRHTLLTFRNAAVELTCTGLFISLMFAS